MGKGDYEFLVEKEAMWAEMLMQVLKDNCIPHAAHILYSGTGIYVCEYSLWNLMRSDDAEYRGAR